MKFIHTADLHIGKTVNGFSMLEDQKFILEEIIRIACVRGADAVVLSGDLYDRSVPSAEAVTVMDSFISRLIQEGIRVLAINGNHDSPERLGFASSIMAGQGFFIESCFDGSLKSVVLKDEFGEVRFYLMPFIKPAFVDGLLEEEIRNSQEALTAILKQAKIDSRQRNIMIAHHFVTFSGTLPAQSPEEETVYVGDIDNVDVSCFHIFDYTALGHIHKSMQIGEGHVYYSGSPLKYSMKEAGHKKGIYLVELREKGEVQVEKIALAPLRDMRIIKGKIQKLLEEDVVNQGNYEDYICAVLTDTEELIDPIGKLRNVYPNIMQVIFEKHESVSLKEDYLYEEVQEKSVQEMYESFYEYVTGNELNEGRRQILCEIIEEAEKGVFL